MTIPTQGQLGVLGTNVSAVPETLSYAQSLADDFATQDFNLPPNYLASQVPQLGDSMEGQLAPWDFIVVESGSYTSNQGVDRGAYLTGVKYAKPKRPYDAGITATSGTSTGSNGAATLIDTSKVWAVNAWTDYAVTITSGTGSGQWRPIISNTATTLTVAKAWTTVPDATSAYNVWAVTEILREPRTGRLGRYWGTRTFLIVDTLAETIANAMFPEGTMMATSGPWAFAPLREKTVERRWRVGLAKVTCLYDTYAKVGELQVIGKGVLECDGWVVPRDFKVLPNGETIGVPFKSGTADRCWVLTKGSSVWSDVFALLSIHVLLDTQLLWQIGPLVGKTNQYACPNIVGAGAKQLWFTKPWFRQRKYGQGFLYDCVLGLVYNPNGWDNESIATLMEYHFKTKAVETAAGAATTQVQPSWSWEPVVSQEEETIARILPGTEISFSLLDSFLAP